MKNVMKKALVFWGGWDGHTPRECAEKYHDFLEKNDFEVTVSTDQNIYADKNFMSTLNLIVPIVTMSEINLEQVNGLLNAVRNGVGIAGHHGGMSDSYRKNTEYQFMVGGQFISHPGGITEFFIDDAGSGDPIMKGIDSFKIKSEQYFMHVDPSNLVLATTTFSDPVYDENSSISNINFPNSWIKGAVMPYIWKRMYGKGKVFYSSIGHTVSDFENELAWTIQKRGLLWATK
mgnify:CR=1 FL=1|tara:strand:- start:1435 stop:2130 length:696 start_codon:yes stop_codon:yes gene_type:complete